MNTGKAGLQDETLRNRKRDVCAHQRLVVDQVNEDGAKTGRLVCRECGEITGGSMKSLENNANSMACGKANANGTSCDSRS